MLNTGSEVDVTRPHFHDDGPKRRVYDHGDDDGEKVAIIYCVRSTSAETFWGEPVIVCVRLFGYANPHFELCKMLSSAPRRRRLDEVAKRWNPNRIACIGPPKFYGRHDKMASVRLRRSSTTSKHLTPRHMSFPNSSHRAHPSGLMH